ASLPADAMQRTGRPGGGHLQERPNMSFAPLKGVTVVELTDNASAPYAGEILAHLGADVWKIERPEGDASRSWGPSIWRGCGASFHALNRGKSAVALDIKNPDDLAALKTLIAQR